MSLGLKRFIQILKNYFWHLPKSIYFNYYYGFPSKKLFLIGVTGTDGKTTTCALIHQLLTNAGYKADSFTTINSPGLHVTSPDSSIVQKILKEKVTAGITHLVIETTAHGLDQFRFWGCKFDIGIITNVSHEHFDDYLNFNTYIKAKTKLFYQSKFAIINKDDRSYEYISKNIHCPYRTYSLKNESDYQGKIIKIEENLLKFKINNQLFTTDSPYTYLVYNILPVFILSQKLNIKTNDFQNLIKYFPQTKGRREEIENNINIKTIIDFAHTPASLEATLTSLEKITKNKLIVIFGATGGRDQSKRPLMGKTVSEIANIAIITADDTRHESIEKINSQIISGINPRRSQLTELPIDKKKIKDLRLESENKFIYFNIPHRQDAFNLAIKIAEPGDTVIACGKGHEDTILHGSTEYPWSETEAFNMAIKNRSRKV